MTPEELSDVLTDVLYRRNGVLIPAVARRTAIAWVTPQVLASTPLYWCPLPELPEVE